MAVSSGSLKLTGPGDGDFATVIRGSNLKSRKDKSKSNPETTRKDIHSSNSYSSDWTNGWTPTTELKYKRIAFDCAVMAKINREESVRHRYNGYIFAATLLLITAIGGILQGALGHSAFHGEMVSPTIYGVIFLIKGAEQIFTPATKSVSQKNAADQLDVLGRRIMTGLSLSPSRRKDAKIEIEKVDGAYTEIVASVPLVLDKDISRTEAKFNSGKYVPLFFVNKDNCRPFGKFLYDIPEDNKNCDINIVVGDGNEPFGTDDEMPKQHNAKESKPGEMIDEELDEVSLGASGTKKAIFFQHIPDRNKFSGEMNLGDEFVSPDKTRGPIGTPVGTPIISRAPSPALSN